MNKARLMLLIGIVIGVALTLRRRRGPEGSD
jgi:hypothetical protein